MLLKIYSIKDSKAAAYGTPFFQPTRGLALRAFIDLSMDSQSMPAKHPSDFALFELGEFDQLTGMITYSEPEFLGYAADFIDAIQANPPRPAAVA